MSYSKVITYGRCIEIYQYENSPTNNGRRRGKSQDDDVFEDVALRRKDTAEQQEQKQAKRRDNTRRSAMAFRRLVSANLSKQDIPVLVSLTYAENVTDPRQGRKDFNTFARNVRNQFGSGIRYICVPEFQERGAIHFHALFWGIPAKVVKRERRTRMVATLWGKGFIDLVQTDGKNELAGYLSKYMAKSFDDERMYGMKAYLASRNVKRPKVDKRPVVLSYIYEYELSPVDLVHDRIYLTQWLGECRYRLYEKD